MSYALIAMAVVIAGIGTGWAATAIRLGGYREELAKALGELEAADLAREAIRKEIEELAADHAQTRDTLRAQLELKAKALKEAQDEIRRRRRPGDGLRRLRGLSEAEAPPADPDS